ncbi:MAG: zinc ribbon domain-containing protein [Chlamydiae bacterium]|nr:zinc ribbon domain-containing protein [Chlamydiota bacterium]MBI3276618.1 zinc ribbon domain-containing protein [Chlamydiota bacterium]
MPTYEYKCSRCHKVFEKFQRMTERPLRTCPSCKGRVKRLLGTGAGIIFKGSGFYSTDYRSESYKTSAKKEGESKSEKSDKKDSSKPSSK